MGSTNMEFWDEAVRRIAPCGYGKYPYVTVEPGAELRLPWWVQGILFQCRHALKCT